MINFEHAPQQDCVDLGAVSAETKGPMGTQLEPGSIGRLAGLTDDD